MECFVIENMEKMKPKEFCNTFDAYVTFECASKALLERIEFCIKSKYTEFRSEDVTSIYSNIAILGFPMKGEVWAKIQKVVSKLIGNF
jgi:hypothetical protein